MSLTPLLSPLTTPCDWVLTYKQQAADFIGIAADDDATLELCLRRAAKRWEQRTGQATEVCTFTEVCQPLDHNHHHWPRLPHLTHHHVVALSRYPLVGVDSVADRDGNAITEFTTSGDIVPHLHFTSNPHGPVKVVYRAGTATIDWETRFATFALASFLYDNRQAYSADQFFPVPGNWEDVALQKWNGQS